MADLNVEVQGIARIGGYGKLVVTARDGELKACRLEAAEAPRYFEVLLAGRPYTQASHITSRICGVCSVAHATASLRAVENALDITPSEQTVLLRKLNLFGEIMASHVRHVAMLVAPDLLGVGSALPLFETVPEVMQRALRLGKLAGDLCACIGGRRIHPLTLAVGGFTRVPTVAELKALRQRLVAARADIDATVQWAQALPWPQFRRETEYVALRAEDEYALIDGAIATSTGRTYALEDYRHVTDMRTVPRPAAERAAHQHESYMVGALARFNINYDKLHPRAKAAAEVLGLAPVCTNPFLNTVAQVVEMVHCLEAAIQISDELIVQGPHPEPLPALPDRDGEGVGACEAPQGIIIHHYRIGADGLVAGARCITPTGLNLANIEADLRKLALEMIDRPDDDIPQRLEMLVRAYDPCFSGLETLE